jgi:hypothetical protein
MILLATKKESFNDGNVKFKRWFELYVAKDFTDVLVETVCINGKKTCRKFSLSKKEVDEFCKYPSWLPKDAVSKYDKPIRRREV